MQTKVDDDDDDDDRYDYVDSMNFLFFVLFDRGIFAAILWKCPRSGRLKPSLPPTAIPLHR